MQEGKREAWWIAKEGEAREVNSFVDGAIRKAVEEDVGDEGEEGQKGDEEAENLERGLFSG